MTNDDVELLLKRAAPPQDAAGAVRAAYAAGRRDAAAAGRWRLAAGVAVSAGLGLAASHLLPGGPPPVPRVPRVVRVEPAPAPPALAVPPAAVVMPSPPAPTSYAAVRAAVFTDDGRIDLDRLPATPAGVAAATFPALDRGSSETPVPQS